MVVGPIATSRYRDKWLAETDSGPRVLNLGGANNLIPGCLSADIVARADVFANILKPLPFPDRSIHAVFCEEVIEHIPREAGGQMLAEIRRILVDGGRLRISTPDLDWFARRAIEAVDQCPAINDIFYNYEHRYIYTRAALAQAVAAAGFVSIQHSSYRDQNSPLGYLDSHADRYGHVPEISQFIDARAPA